MFSWLFDIKEQYTIFFLAISKSSRSPGLHCSGLVLLCCASFLNFAWIYKYFGPLLSLHIGESDGFVLQLNTLMWWMQWSKDTC